MKIKEGLILVFLAGSCILSAGGDVKVAIDAEKCCRRQGLGTQRRRSRLKCI